MSEWVSTAECISEASRAKQPNEWSVQTSKCANGQASSPALQSEFLVILDHNVSISVPASFYSRVCPSILEVTNKHHLDQAHCGSDQPRIGMQVLSHSPICSLFQLLALHCQQRSFICLLTPKLVKKMDDWMSQIDRVLSHSAQRSRRCDYFFGIYQSIIYHIEHLPSFWCHFWIILDSF